MQLSYAVKANPQAEILATLAGIGAGFDEASRGEILAAVAEVIAAGEVRTYDMGGSSTTTEMAEAIAARC